MDVISLVEKLDCILSARRAFASKTAFHSYIVEGEQTVCLGAMRLLSAYALCQEGACGHCICCINAIKGIHVDCVSFPQLKNTLTIEEIATINYESNLSPQVGANKVLLLNAFSQKYSPDWQNKLLKTLEEPPKNVYIFIGCDNAGKLLDTVRSRCELISIARLSDSVIADYLTGQGYSRRSAEIASVLAEGNIANAEQSIAQSNAEAMMQCVVDFFLYVKSSANAVEYIGRFAQYENEHRQLFALMQAVAMDAYCVGSGQARLLSSITDTLIAIRAIYSDDALLRTVQLVDKACARVDSGVSYISTLDNLILKILEVKHKCRL